MIEITQAQMTDLQSGNIPEDLGQELLDEINFAINQKGEAFISFHFTTRRIFAHVVETGNYAVIRSKE